MSIKAAKPNYVCDFCDREKLVNWTRYTMDKTRFWGVGFRYGSNGNLIFNDDLIDSPKHICSFCLISLREKIRDLEELKHLK